MTIQQQIIDRLPREKKFTHPCCQFGKCVECMGVEMFNQALKEVKDIIRGLSIGVDEVKIYSVLKGKKDGKVDFKIVSLAKALSTSDIITLKENT